MCEWTGKNGLNGKNPPSHKRVNILTSVGAYSFGRFLIKYPPTVSMNYKLRTMQQRICNVVPTWH